MDKEMKLKRNEIYGLVREIPPWEWNNLSRLQLLAHTIDPALDVDESQEVPGLYTVTNARGEVWGPYNLATTLQMLAGLTSA